ncbi:MAG: recombinase family protein [Clostridiales bacterium]|nr:recombinase family protein [Clostridiales bacterium]
MSRQKNDRLEKKVGIYCRISTNEKEQLYSLAAQISALTRAVANVSQWRLADVFIDVASAKEKWNKRAIETMIANEKYTGTVTLLDSATQEYQYQMKECYPPIITESGFRAVQEEKKRSNIVTGDGGTRRSSKKYSSKKK